MYLPIATVENIVNELQKKNHRDTVFLLLIAENNSLAYSDLVEALNECQVTFFGAIFPALIYGNEKKNKGVIIHEFPKLTGPILIEGLDKEEFVLPSVQFEEALECGAKSAIMYIDGLTPNITPFFNKLYDNLSHTLDFFGGGAGSLSMQQQPCILSSRGLHQDAAIITFLDLDLDLGVKHGWSKAYGPIVITKGENNVVQELNWENAFEVYQRSLFELSGERVTKENFFETAKSFPFGVYKEGCEDIIRDPVRTNEAGDMIFVGAIPENSAINIMQGTTEELLKASWQAVEEALKDSRPVHCLVTDCISRFMYMGDKLQKELDVVNRMVQASNPDCILEGALTLGEISSFDGKYLEFLNKSIVIGNFYEKEFQK